MKLSSIPPGTSVFIDANIFMFDIFEDTDFGDASYDFIKKDRIFRNQGLYIDSGVG